MWADVDGRGLLDYFRNQPEVRRGVRRQRAQGAAAGSAGCGGGEGGRVGAEEGWRGGAGSADVYYLAVCDS